MNLLLNIHFNIFLDHVFSTKRAHTSSIIALLPPPPVERSDEREEERFARKLQRQEARARARARASYQFDNAHPLNGRRDGRGRSPVSNDVSSSVSFSSSISFTVRAPLTYHRRERKRGDLDDDIDDARAS